MTVQYVGVNYKTGKEFDASWDRGEPFTFTLGAGEVISGLGTGIEGMKVGGRRELIIPPNSPTAGRRAAGDPAERNAGLRRRPRSDRIAARQRQHRLVPRPPLAERLTAQALAGEPLRSPEAVAERLLAVQGQDPRGARLAVRARTEGVTAADVDRALSEDRSLLITWLNRGTLHLVRSEDYPWLHALTTPTTVTAAGGGCGRRGSPRRRPSGRWGRSRRPSPRRGR